MTYALAPLSAQAPASLLFQREQIISDLAATIARRVGGLRFAGDEDHMQSLNTALDVVRRRLQLWQDNTGWREQV